MRQVVSSEVGFFQTYCRIQTDSSAFSVLRQSVLPGQSANAGRCVVLNMVYSSLNLPTQAYSPVLPVGAQHYYKSSFAALKSIWQAEKFRGLVRGIDAAALRTAMGSSVSIVLRSEDILYAQHLYAQHFAIHRYNCPRTTGQRTN